ARWIVAPADQVNHVARFLPPARRFGNRNMSRRFELHNINHYVKQQRREKGNSKTHHVPE
ncbi:hypothetical protein, partial [Paracoccus sp. (in: a-proteobacteria)]|uniref:hypothetical protein n=1 Tax=Paracoccus sp. TaxID=267 RepID=UPI0028AAA923